MSAIKQLDHWTKREAGRKEEDEGMRRKADGGVNGGWAGDCPVYGAAGRHLRGNSVTNG